MRSLLILVCLLTFGCAEEPVYSPPPELESRPLPEIEEAARETEPPPQPVKPQKKKLKKKAKKKKSRAH